jgi:hypothetical protein
MTEMSIKHKTFTHEPYIAALVAHTPQIIIIIVIIGKSASFIVARRRYEVLVVYNICNTQFPL